MNKPMLRTSALALAAALLASPALAERSQDDLDKIAVGQSREEVIQVLGSPESLRSTWSPSAPTLPTRHPNALVYEVAPNPGNDDAFLIVETDAEGKVSKAYIMTEDND